MARFCAAALIIAALGVTARADDRDADARDVPTAPTAARTIHAWHEAATMLATASPELIAASELSERARASADAAVASLLPHVQLTASLEYQPLAALLNPETGEIEEHWGSSATWTPSGAVEISAPIFAPELWARTRAARQRADAAHLDERSARNRAQILLASTLIAAVTAERAGEVARDGLRAAYDRLQLIERRQRMGAATALDVQRYAQDALAARAALVAAYDAVGRAREALAIAVGSKTSVAVAPELTIDQMLADAERACRPVSGPDLRPEVVAAHGGARAASEGVAEASAAYWPTASLTTRYELANADVTGGAVAAQRETTQVWSVLAVITWTLFDGGQRAARARDARALAQSAQGRLDTVQTQAAIDVERANRVLDTARRAHQIAVSALSTARETDRLTRLEQELGRGDAFEAVDAAATLRRSELELTLREYALVQARFGALVSLAACD